MNPDPLYPPGKVLRWKRTGEKVKIIKAVFLQNHPDNFLHYDAKKEFKKGIWAVYPDDLEELE